MTPLNDILQLTDNKTESQIKKQSLRSKNSNIGNSL